MSEIFLSYKKEDKGKAQIIAETLERNEYSVWWDRIIPPGKTFDQVIEEEIDKANCVIVLWSKKSVESDWVKNEAREGIQRGILIPVLIEDVNIPFEFKHIQAANLIDWDGTEPNPEFDLLLGSVSRRLGKVPAPEMEIQKTSDQEKEERKKTEIKKLEEEKQIGNPKQGKFGILIDLSHKQGEWQQLKNIGSIFELVEPERQLISLIHPPEEGQIPWDIQEIKENNQFSSEDFVNWRGLIFGIPYHKKINQNVCNAIVKWVHQGGRLILLGYELGDRHHGANLNQLAQKFGLSFNSDIVGPERFDRPIKPYHHPIKFNVPDSTRRHPILNGVQNLIFRDTCTLTVEAGSSVILTVGNNSVWKWSNAVFDKEGKSCSGFPQKFYIINENKASWVPIIAEAPHSLTCKGRVLAIGTWNFFDTSDYLRNVDNYRFVRNLLEWLIKSPA